MRFVRLLLALLLLVVSCGKFPSAPSTVATPSPRQAPARSADAQGIGAGIPGDTLPAMPRVQSIRVERVGDDVLVALVGRPRSPGAHPTIGPLASGGYRFWFHLVFNEPDQGNIYSISVYPVDEHHVALMFIPFGPEAASLGTAPAYSEPSEAYPLRGTGTSWHFRFPLSTAVSLGGYHFLWHMILDSDLPRSPGYSREDYFGTVDLSK